MTRAADEESSLVRYLLGDGSDTERQRIEQRFFNDDESFEELSALEEALIDDYVTDRLPSADRALFERRLNTSHDWQQRVRFARDLAAVARLARRRRSGFHGRWPRFTWARRPLAAVRAAPAYALLWIAVGVVGGLNAWLTLESARLRTALELSMRDRTQLESTFASDLLQQRRRADEQASQLDAARAQLEELQVELNTRPIAARAPLVASFVLTRGLRRGDPLPALSIPVDAEVRLELDLEGAELQRAYRAVLETAVGHQVWSGDLPNADGPSDRSTLGVRIPPGILTDGEYSFVLWMRGDVGILDRVADYHFNVVRR